MKFYEWLNVRPPSNRKTDDAIVRFMNSGEIPDSIWHPNFRWTTYEEYLAPGDAGDGICRWRRSARREAERIRAGHRAGLSAYFAHPSTPNRGAFLPRLWVASAALFF